MTEKLGRLGWVVLDACWWITAMLMLAGVPHHDPVHVAMLPELALLGASAAALHVAVGCLIGAYLTRHDRGSFDELVTLVQTVVITGLTLEIIILAVAGNTLTPWLAPTASALALCAMLGTRFANRSLREHRANARSTGATTVVIGAGTGGRHLVENMLADDRASYRPVAFLDDDPAKRRLRVHGIPVLGDRHLLATVARRTRATHAVVAIPSVDSAALREMRDLAATAGLHLLVLPTVDELLGDRPGLRDLRDIDLADLLGRRPVQLDEGAIADQITGKVVLVTGAGGSIGSELCQQIARFSPSRLLMLDRDESALHAVQLALTGRGLLEGDDLLLVDIRDAAAVRDVFETHHPDVVFHAAALKHLTLLEKHPLEAWKTNVVGTLNVLTAAEATGVRVLVNISTDKAADPTCVLGHSKRTAERLTADFARKGKGRFVSVRFGNVLGSRGSVIPAFTEQIRRGGPVTVTHPEVERYFMLIPEACQLVLQAAAVADDGEVVVLDMGSPVRIDDVARTLLKMSGREDVDIVYTGLRPGEKLTESLFGLAEEHRATSHCLLTSVRVPALPRQSLGLADWVSALSGSSDATASASASASASMLTAP